MQTGNDREQSTKKFNDHTLGILYILLSAFGFSLMSFFVRLSGDVPTMQKAFFRNIVALIVSVVILLRTPEKFYVRKTSWKYLFLRAAFGTTGLVLNFWVIDRLGIADANMLNKMSPFFAIVMSLFILGEVPDKVEWLSVVIAFVGAAFVVKPTAGLASFPAAMGLFGGFCAGTAYTFVRKLRGAGERGPVIVAFFSLFSTIVCVPSLMMHATPMNLRQWLFLILAGISAAGAQLAITAAYSHAPAKEISVFDYSQVLFAALLGVLFLGEVPDIFSMIGYVIIIGTAIARWMYNRKTYRS